MRHTTEFLADRLPSSSSRTGSTQPVALHYHSQSEPRRREGAAARRLLEAVPGLRYVDVGSEPRFGRLCTVDVQAQLGQDVWDGLIRDEIGRARAGGAEILATVYHGCQRLVCGFEAEGAITIEHYLSVFARALGIESRTGSRNSDSGKTRSGCWPSRRRARPQTTSTRRARGNLLRRPSASFQSGGPGQRAGIIAAAPASP